MRGRFQFMAPVPGRGGVVTFRDWPRYFGIERLRVLIGGRGGQLGESSLPQVVR